MNIGQKIKYLRRQRRWSQLELAGRMGKSIPAISKIELGLTDIRLSRLEQVAAAFELPLTDFLRQPGESCGEMADGNSLALLNDKLAEHEARIAALQGKLRELYEELQCDNITPLNTRYKVFNGD